MNLLLVNYTINRLNVKLLCNIDINELSMSVSKTSGRCPVLSREENQSCSLRNTKTILNVFIRTIFDDWVFCVMREYHSNQSAQFNMAKSECKYKLLQISL